MVTTVQEGDFVTVGRSSLTWRVLNIDGRNALLKSGQSNRTRTEPVANLVYHSRYSSSDVYHSRSAPPPTIYDTPLDKLRKWWEEKLGHPPWT